ncbi:MAG: HlyD family secretion protein [Deltaproteobacteria bacterium]|nr:HlyD family secretion protein [Deltaproteobacteria bacterium]
MSEQPYDEQPRSAKKKWLVVLLLLIGLPVGGYYGFAAWKHAATHVSTDNAYVQADMAQITPRVPGTVIDVLVHENWWVKPGQVLVRLDTRDYEVRLAEAKAALTQARESVDQLFAAVAVADERRRATQSQIQVAQAEVAVVQAEFHQTELDFHRAQQLTEEQIIPVQRFDQAKTQYQAARSRLHAKQQQLEEAKQNAITRGRETDQARAALGNTVAGERSEHSLVKQAEAAVHEAELNLSYCTLGAPLEGMVSRKAIEVGQRVQPGQALMALLPLHKVYIEANYKETQLTQVRVGQPVEIRADVYPDHVYHGTVESLSGGTGAAFSLLPPENATGNWVKVVQRLPVKIALTEPPPPDLPLRVGLSVEASINIGNQDGSRLSSLLQEQEQKERAYADTLPRELADPSSPPAARSSVRKE